MTTSSKPRTRPLMADATGRLRTHPTDPPHANATSPTGPANSDPTGPPHANAANPTRPLRADATQPVQVLMPGTIGYAEAWDLQRRLVARRAIGEIGDVLLLLEHPPVYTMGKRTDPAHLVWDEATRAAHGISLVEVDRGGDVTYHGPGQLVGYPILALASIRSVVDYVRALEEVLIRALHRFDVDASRSPGYTGVWVGDEKIAAIGVRVSSGPITSHGFALNVSPDLGDFAGIVPCGIGDRGVCSLTSLGVEVEMTHVIDAVQEAFTEVFAATLEPGLLADLGLAANRPTSTKAAT